MNLVCCYLLAAVVSITASEVQKLYNLPEEHMGAFFRDNPEAARSCQEEHGCPYKVSRKNAAEFKSKIAGFLYSFHTLHKRHSTQ
ncbi:hypothetical protein MTO96_035974 [Rhipicephalus appendiculatus]